MPNRVLHVLLAISVLIAALLIAGVGTGLAYADPENSGNPPEPETGVETPASSEPEPTTGLPTTALPTTGLPAMRPPGIFDIPQTIVTQLRDMFGRPLSVVGNGRVPGTLTESEADTPGATTGRKRDRTPAKDERKPDLTPPEPIVTVPARRPTSSVEVTLPLAPPIIVRVPSIPVPGYENMRWSLNLTDPLAAYTSVAQTLNTVNSLLLDVYAPHGPTKPPAPSEPAQGPAFRTFEEEPGVAEVDGGAGGITPLSGGSDLPVLQAPVVVPQMRMAAPPRPIQGTIPAEVQVPAAGAVSAPAAPGSVAQPGSVSRPGSAPIEQLPPNASPAAMGNLTPRVGYPRYLRSARTNQVATVALPGLAGLIAITASGGVIGYRQANSGRYLRSEAARFLQ